MTQKRYLKIFTSAFFIFYLLFFIFPAPAHAADNPPQLNPFCFTKDECQNPPYRGAPSPFEAPECRDQDKKLVNVGYLYYCYAPQPTMKLQVSIGGYKVQGIGEYIKRLYTYFVGISGIVAALMIIWAGIKWLTAGGAPDRITDAKKKIANAAVGLCLLLGSYVILQTINPDLVNLKMPPIKIPRQELTGVTMCAANRPEFECGKKYQCDDPYLIGRGFNPCSGGVNPGECIGKNCSQAGGGECSKLDPDKVLAVDPEIIGDRDLLPAYEPLMVNLLYTAALEPEDIADWLDMSLDGPGSVNILIETGAADQTGTNEWACVNLCPSECGSLSPTGDPSTSFASNLKKLQTCISSACNCIVSYIGAPSDPNKIMPSCQAPPPAPAVPVTPDIPVTPIRDIYRHGIY